MPPKTDMNAMMRSKRKDLNAYMYPDEETSEPTASDTPEEETTEMTVLAPGDEDPQDQYVYEPNDSGGWVVYPPGTPCDTSVYRIAMDHPASAEEMTRMQEQLDSASPSNTTAPASGDYGASNQGGKAVGR